MRTTLTTVALAGALGLTGAAGAALLTPAASYAETGDSAALTARVASIKQALAGLVTDGTLTQAQADSVAGAVAESAPLRGPGGHGGHGGHGAVGHGVGLSAAAEALGVTEEELRAAGEAGKTLAGAARRPSVISRRRGRAPGPADRRPSAGSRALARARRPAGGGSG